MAQSLYISSGDVIVPFRFKWRWHSPFTFQVEMTQSLYISSRDGTMPFRFKWRWHNAFLPGLGIRSFDFRADRSFLSKNEWMSDSLQKMRYSLIRSFFMSEMSNLLTSLFSSEWPERIAHGRSCLVSEMNNSLTSLIWFERNERLTHIANQKRGNERKWAIRSFVQKNLLKKP